MTPSAPNGTPADRPSLGPDDLEARAESFARRYFVTHNKAGLAVWYSLQWWRSSKRTPDDRAALERDLAEAGRACDPALAPL